MNRFLAGTVPVLMVLLIVTALGCNRPAPKSQPAGQNSTSDAPNGTDSPHAAQDPKPFRGHAASIRFLTFSHDGKRLLTGSTGQRIELRDGEPESTPADDKSARVWDVAAGREIARFEEHAQGVACGALSGDGSLAATADGRTVRVWTVEQSRQKHELSESPAKIVALGFSSDGKRLAAAGDDKFIRLWNVDSGTPLRAWDEPEAAIHGVIFSPDDQYLASVGRDGVRVWDLAREQIARALDEASPLAASFSSDSKKLFVLAPLKGADSPGDEKAAAKVIGAMVFEWDLDSGAMTAHEPITTNGVERAALAPDGSKFLVAGMGAGGRMLVHVYDIAKKQETAKFDIPDMDARTPNESVLMAVAPDGKKAAIVVSSASDDEPEPKTPSDATPGTLDTVQLRDLPE